MHGLSGRKGTKGILKSDSLTDKKGKRNVVYFPFCFHGAVLNHRKKVCYHTASEKTDGL